MVTNLLKKLLLSLADGGRLLILAALAAILFVNFGFADEYERILHLRIGFDIGSISLNNSLAHWINDGLMALFFLLVGLELKREFVIGELSTRSQVALPMCAALGGMFAPAMIFYLLNYQSPELIHGWAIPAATDIAFSLAVLAILADRVPLGLRVFLTTVAVVDDLGAIIVIALFYTATIALNSLAMAAGCLAILIAFNRLRVRHLLPYLLVGALLWFFTLKSGVHATIAGVLLAFTIPITPDSTSPLQKLEHAIHPWVSFLVLPIFGFANAGVPLANIGVSELTSPLVLGIALGLFVGKQIGIFGAAWMLIKCGLAKLPSGSNFRQLHAVAVIAGIGFTMSLFVGVLAYSDEHHLILTRIGVLMGSLASALVGYALLRTAR